MTLNMRIRNEHDTSERLGQAQTFSRLNWNATTLFTRCRGDSRSGFPSPDELQS